MWPGSPQTALIFVGLPLLTALVLLAAPLHDAAPLAPREETVAVTGVDMTEPEQRLAEQPIVVAAMPRAVVRRPREQSAVPAVIYETRRRLDRPRELARAAPSGGMPASSLGTQSP